jgi:hypothetical protein
MKYPNKLNSPIKWVVFAMILLSPILFGAYLAKLPTVTLDNDVIHIGGRFGDTFKISEIQSVDTVSVYPKIERMLGGSGLFISNIGNFKLENEEETAKLCFYRNKPPIIKIRMNNNGLLLLNFNESDKTIEFYRQLKNNLSKN